MQTTELFGYRRTEFSQWSVLPAVVGFGERFTEAQKSSQAMRHFLPKLSSSAAASSRPKSAPTQQPLKPAPAAAAAAKPDKPEPR